MSALAPVHIWTVNEGEVFCADSSCDGHHNLVIDLGARGSTRFTTAALVEALAKHCLKHGRAEVVDPAVTVTHELISDARALSWGIPAAVSLGAAIAMTGAVVGRVLGW